MTLTIKLDGNWSSFQLANSAPPLSVTDSAIAPSARIRARTARGERAAQKRETQWRSARARRRDCERNTYVGALVPGFEIHAIAWARPQPLTLLLGRMPRKNCRSHIDASHSRQPLVKGERLVRYEVNAVMRQKQVLDT